MIATAVLSFDRWDIALHRLEGYIAEQRESLKQAITPVRIDLSTRELLLPRAQVAHTKIFELITVLDGALALQAHIRALYRRSEVSFGLQDLDDQIQGLSNVSELLDEITDAPSRLDVLHELEYAHKRFESLRVAGEGDLTRAERQHLKDLKFDLPAVGHEDFVPLNNYHERINAQLDALTAQRKEVRARSGFQIGVADENQTLLTKIGLQFYAVPQEQNVPDTPDMSDIKEASSVTDSRDERQATEAPNPELNQSPAPHSDAVEAEGLHDVLEATENTNEEGTAAPPSAWDVDPPQQKEED